MFNNLEKDLQSVALDLEAILLVDYSIYSVLIG